MHEWTSQVVRVRQAAAHAEENQAADGEHAPSGDDGDDDQDRGAQRRRSRYGDDSSSSSSGDGSSSSGDDDDDDDSGDSDESSEDEDDDDDDESSEESSDEDESSEDESSEEDESESDESDESSDVESSSESSSAWSSEDSSAESESSELSESSSSEGGRRRKRGRPAKKRRKTSSKSKKAAKSKLKKKKSKAKRSSSGSRKKRKSKKTSRKSKSTKKKRRKKRSPSPSPKRRGRPAGKKTKKAGTATKRAATKKRTKSKKSTKTAAAAAAASSSAPVKRKRGRPRKNPEEKKKKKTKSKTVKGKRTSKTRKKRARRSSSSSESSESDKEPAPVVKKRGPGRPRKHPLKEKAPRKRQRSTKAKAKATTSKAKRKRSAKQSETPSAPSLTPAVAPPVQAAPPTQPAWLHVPAPPREGVPGQVGLENLGNSCFLNSVLQALSNTPQFRQFFLELYPAPLERIEPSYSHETHSYPFASLKTGMNWNDGRLNDVHRQRKRRKNGKSNGDGGAESAAEPVVDVSLCDEISVLFHELWQLDHQLYEVKKTGRQRNLVLNPAPLLIKLGQIFPIFGQLRQQDAQECFRLLLDRIEHELDMKRARLQPEEEEEPRKVVLPPPTKSRVLLLAPNAPPKKPAKPYRLDERTATRLRRLKKGASVPPVLTPCPRLDSARSVAVLKQSRAVAGADPRQVSEVLGRRKDRASGVVEYHVRWQDTGSVSWCGRHLIHPSQYPQLLEFDVAEFGARRSHTVSQEDVQGKLKLLKSQAKRAAEAAAAEGADASPSPMHVDPTAPPPTSIAGRVLNRFDIVSDTFRGELQSEVTCPNCKHCITKTDPFLDLSLNVPDAHTSVVVQRVADGDGADGSEPGYRCRPFNITHCLRRFCRVEELMHSELYSCTKCLTRVPALKRIRLRRLPEVLCVHLKRFRWAYRRRSKISTPVQFPMRDLDLSEFMADGDALQEEIAAHGSCMYDLISMVAHHGNGLRSGHYTTFALNTEGGDQWLHFNDAKVKQCTAMDVANEQAYLLFYQRRSKNV